MSRLYIQKTCDKCGKEKGESAFSSIVKSRVRAETLTTCRACLKDGPAKIKQKARLETLEIQFLTGKVAA